MPVNQRWTRADLGLSRCSASERWPAPSETTARSACVCAAVWSSSSPPTESPRPPMRAGSTSGCRRRKRDGGAQVGLAGPAEGVVVALARALAAAVEQEHAVAVADEHPRVRHRLRAARERDDGGAVARRDVPGTQSQSVARGQPHVARWGRPRSTAARRASVPCASRRSRSRWGERPGRRARGPRRRRPHGGGAAGRASPSCGGCARASRHRARRGRCRRHPPSTAVTSSPLTRSTTMWRTPSVTPPMIARAPAKMASQPRTRPGTRGASAISSAAHGQRHEPADEVVGGGDAGLRGAMKASSATASAPRPRARRGRR